MAGATMGTRMNIEMMKDITRAISRPSNWSRISATTTIRGPAAPSPCRKRPASMPAKLVENMDTRQPIENTAKPM